MFTCLRDVLAVNMSTRQHRGEYTCPNCLLLQRLVYPFSSFWCVANLAEAGAPTLVWPWPPSASLPSQHSPPATRVSDARLVGCGCQIKLSKKNISIYINNSWFMWWARRDLSYGSLTDFLCMWLRLFQEHFNTSDHKYLYELSYNSWKQGSVWILVRGQTVVHWFLAKVSKDRKEVILQPANE